MNYKVLKIALLIGGFFLMVLIVALAFIFTKDYVPKGNDLIYSISTIPIPQNIKNIEHPIYTPNNKIVFSYDDATTNESYIAVMDDDGKNFHNIYQGKIPVLPKANGVRIMPFADNKRLLLGDHVVETEPDLDNADIKKTKLLLINYPDMGSLYVLNRWSEIIIAPDNIHMAWTTLAAFGGSGTSVNFMGRLEKNATGDGYNINKATIISDFVFAHEIPNMPGFLEPIKYIHGGEIKQFTDGGMKITLAGAVRQGMSRSIVQDLESNATYALSLEPGYEETSIISPDGKLGIAMSTRFSPQTNCAILGLLPRPDSVFTLMGMNRYAYTYSVTQVRTKRIGNVGPALYQVDKSINDRNYHGHDLHDPSDNQAWVFRSPMSWHQSSTKAIWPERHRITNENRIRKVVIETDSSKTSYAPGEPIKARDTPDKAPYSLPLTELDHLPSLFFNGTFKGVNGFMDCDRQANYIHTKYRNYSVDGKVFANGYESFDIDSKEITYVGNVTLSGADSGSMDFKLVFSAETNDLLKEKCFGYSTYDGRTIKTDDMIE